MADLAPTIHSSRKTQFGGKKAERIGKIGNVSLGTDLGRNELNLVHPNIHPLNVLYKSNRSLHSAVTAACRTEHCRPLLFEPHFP